jgi:hypothetical protein
MPRYKISTGEIYNILEKEVSDFLSVYPNATLIEEAGKEEDPVKEAADAGSKNQAVAGDFTLDPGLSELAKPKVSYVYADGSEFSEPELLKSLRNLDIKFTGTLSRDIYDFEGKVGYKKAFKVKDNITDEALIKAYINQFPANKRPEKVYNDQKLDEVVINTSLKVNEARKVQKKLDFLKPNEDQLLEIEQQAEQVFVPSEQLPDKILYINQQGQSVMTKDIPADYEEYLKKANNDLQKAKELYVKDKKKSAHKDNIDEWAQENTSLFDGKSVSGFLEQQEKAAKIIGDWEAKQLVGKAQTANELNLEIKANTAALNDLQYKAYGEKNPETIANIVKDYEEIYNNTVYLSDKAKELYNEQIELSEKTGDNELILDAVKRSYAGPTVLMGNLTGTVANIVGGALKIPEWLYVSLDSAITGDDPTISSIRYKAMATAAPSGLGGAQVISDAAIDLSKNIRSNIAEPIDVTDIKSLSDFGMWAGEVTFNQLPNAALMIAAPEIALPILGASAAGNKYDQMIENSFLYGEEYKPWQIFSAPLIVGSAEYLTEKITFGQLKGISNILKSKPDALKAANEYIQNNILKGQYFVTTLGEAGGEGVATLTENITDIYMLNDKTKHIWDGVPNAVASGAFMSGVIFKAPAVGARLLRPFASDNLQTKLINNAEQLRKISKELEENKNLDNFAKDELVKAQIKITEDSNNSIKNSLARADLLTEAEKAKLIEIDKLAADELAAMREIYNNKTIDDAAKPDLIKGYKKEYLALQKDKADIIKFVERDQLLASAIEATGIKNTTYVSLNNDQEIDAYLQKKLAQDITDADAAQKEKDEKFIVNVKTNFGTIIQDFETGEQEIIINKGLARRYGYVATADHEFLHAVLYNTIKNNPQAQVNLGKALTQELENVFGKTELANTQFKRRLDVYLQDVKEGKIKENEAWEEALTLFSEALVYGDIIVEDVESSRSFVERIKKFFETLFSKYIGAPIKFNNGQDVIQFVKDYKESFETGKWSASMRKTIAKGAKGTLVEGGAFVPAKTTKKLSQAPKGSLDVILNKYTQKPDGTSKYTSKEEFQTSADVGEVYNLIQETNLLDGEIRKRATLAGIPTENLDLESIRGNIAMRVLTNFDPSKNNLFGYLLGKVNIVDKAVKDEAKKFVGQVETGAARIDTAAGEVGAVAELAADEVTLEEKETRIAEETAEEAKYTKIKDANAFDSAVLDKAKEKVLQTVRTLKNKLGTAVSKNVSVTPIMEEFVQDVSKQIDIDLKKAMGGKKDNELRNWTIRNKKAIIENATTTWLMGKDNGKEVLGGIPVTIEKSIGGRYTGQFEEINLGGKTIKVEVFEPNFIPYPEWVGKNIDREKTKELGKTSGNQIVRRVDPAKIDDIEFANFITETDGNPIRGRKESLAKEMSGELGLELFVEGIRNPESDIAKAFEQNQELRGEVLDENYKVELERQAERGTIKNSKAIAGIQAINLVSRNQVTLITEAVNAWNQPTKTKRKAAVKALLNSKKGAELADATLLIEQLAQGQTYLDAKSEASWKLAEKLALESLFVLSKSLEGFKVIDPRTGKPVTNKKQLAEISVGYDSTLPDVLVEYNGIIIPIEIKLDKLSRLGNVTLNKYGNIGKITEIQDPKTKEDFINNFYYQILQNDRYNKFIKYLDRIGVNTKAETLNITEAQLEKINKKYGSLFKASAIFNLTAPIEYVWEHYFDKNFPIDYLNSSDYGFVYLKNNPLKLNIPQLTGDLNIKGFLTAKKVSDRTYSLRFRVAPELTTESSNNIAEQSNVNVYSTASMAEALKTMKNSRVFEEANMQAKAVAVATSDNFTAEQKGISVWDFDDTLAVTKSNVLYTMPDGTKGKIDATEFALQGERLANLGAEFDFSEFSKVMEGAKGPMFEKALARNKKFGNKNVYILTARPANSKFAIHNFLKGIGLNIKLDNIIGLGNSSAQAKADWITSKVAEGYNDFYFADDAYKNVDAVQNVLNTFNVKSDVKQVKFSKAAKPEFNRLIERATGIPGRAQISEKKAAMLGKNKGRFRFFIPPSADDFAGLMYYLYGKGAQGNADMKFIKETLFDPFAEGIRNYESAKQLALNEYRELKKLIRKTPTKLARKNETAFTNEQAVRVYLWDKAGYEIPGMTKKDVKELVSIVKNNTDLLNFAGNVKNITIFEGYPAPENNWEIGTLTTDLLSYVNDTVRSQFLEKFNERIDLLFDDNALNKLEQGFGKNYRDALEDIIYRMKTGRRKVFGSNKLTNSLMNWVNDSVGTVMFFNTRSALLQQISLINFVNFNDNNPLAASAAFANQKQFWKDYAMLFNSDFLKQRRAGLKTDVNADEIAKAAEEGTNKVRAVIASILKKGFLPTQLADSHAIALGGASFYRNRVNSYLKQGLSQKDADNKAFLDFQEIAEETQQSSRPDRISMQQASPIGRVILAFANTPMQYARLTKKAALDLYNGRGDWKTNMSKLMYYSFVQNVIFTTLQQAVFALAFDDEEDDEKKKDKYFNVANGMADSLLRGLGFGGAAVATGKNVVLEIIDQYESKRPDYKEAALKSLSLSPPIDTKLRKLISAGRTFTYRQSREKMRTEGLSLDNPIFEATGQVLSATTNIPLDRVVRKLDNLSTPVRQDVETWQAISLALGYSKWDVGLIEKSTTKKKSKYKQQLFKKIKPGGSTKFKR